MTSNEYFAPVTHKHLNCTICSGIELIHDVQPPRSEWDKLIMAVRAMNVRFQIAQGKPIYFKEEK